MNDTLINQDDEPVWYKNDRVIQEYLNRSRKNTTKKEDGQADRSSGLKIMKKSRRKT
jgi:hypothetical protein